MVNAEHLLKAVTEMVKFNSANYNALDVKAALMDKDLLVMCAKHQDQHVIATNHTTLELTDVTIAQLVNYLETVEPIKMVSALSSTKDVMQMVKDNSVNNNAINANLAKLDIFLETTMFALDQDQLVNAIKLLMLLQISARTAQEANLVSIKVLANRLPNHVSNRESAN